MPTVLIRGVYLVVCLRMVDTDDDEHIDALELFVAIDALTRYRRLSRLFGLLSY